MQNTEQNTEQNTVIFSKYAFVNEGLEKVTKYSKLLFSLLKFSLF